MSSDKELVRAVKDLKRMKRQAATRKFMSSMGNLVPKGIRHPDSLVGNRHLFIPGLKGKTKLR